MGVYIFLLVFIISMLVIHEKLFDLNANNGITLSKRDTSLKKMSFISVFLTLGLFSAFRDGIGIDYISYIMHIERIAMGLPNYMEPGFQYLAKFIMYITKDPRMVIGAASIITSFFYVSAIYKQSNNIKFSVFLFLTWGYYFFTFNTIRNYLALSIVIYAIVYLFDRKYFKFIFGILIAALFHKSALICLPLYFIASKKINKQTYLLIAMSSLLLFFLKDLLRDVAFWIYPQYEGTVYDTGRISIFNILKSSVVLFYGVMYYSKIKADIKLRTYFNLNFFSLIIYTSLYWLPEISRIGFYFNIVSIFLIPNLTILIKKRDRMIINLLIYSFSIIIFVLLMRSFYAPNIKLLPYNSWLF
ncbi:EpsG-like putative glucosyltransferase [Streptohalobacillus salinus]|uniref:EpsG-like putative glucosyltransferase n=1 Tax=Streptohalobacillus salinus TaxID=621096 RepID=A0A2V3WBQ8_9BACI|nr:EpsG family protein [Streptohalobacillus salinus]PXW92009.1 EpsG-like putative glucosyltransferase [Streptohalobacillus salinus]